jgi:16S rRNA C967 or C1407 C5-methylase (RsmB/RsmF family)/NOL1/NOP2/fmu family ribosome biogenesis protein
LPNPLPEALIKSLTGLNHFNPHAFRSVHDSGEQLVSVHFNPGKPIFQNGSWANEITEPPFQISGKIPWAPDAWYLDVRPSFTLDPFFHAGVYYVQEASGMFLAFALKQITDLSKKLSVLDLCAAPGGKSTMIQSLISPESLLVSNEVIKTRVPVLHQNMTKWGRANGIVSNNDPAFFKQLPGFFDLVIVDAPCSGSGLFRKDPEAVKTWSPESVHLCSQRQTRILADIWDAIKENGFLIYCTCSYSKEENEDVLDNLFQQYDCKSVPLLPDPDWHIVESIADQSGAYGYRFYPDQVHGEGFFLSVIQKKEPVISDMKNNHYQRSGKIRKNPERIDKRVEKQLNRWIQEGSFHYYPVGEGVHALPPGLVDDFILLKNVLYLKKAGVRVGKPGETEWIPDHELALAGILSDKSARIDLGKPETLSFLRGESFEMGAGEKGWRLVCFGGQGLGWVKLLDKRMNNYYPKSWRIRL